jgi:CheY-like chemotaxis protein/HPt (histidine-containing phosphotransfer) domain-containing protein
VVMEFRIMDTGIGLSAEDQEKLFQPFSQADSSVTRKFGGTGLGLAISKKLVELMSGRIGVESQLGQGSTFWFTIPFLKKGKERGPALHPEAPESPAFAQARGEKNIRILVADDNEFNRILAQEQLLKLGYGVETVSNGAEALRVLASGDYPLVLMDCRMPELDGYQATTEIRKKETKSSSRTIVIAMTANVLQSEYKRGMAAGMDDYLTKPVKIGHLKNILDRWLPHSPEAVALSPAPFHLSTYQTEKPVDLQVLLDATDGNDEALTRLTAAFCSQSEDLLKRLEQSIEQGSAKEIERVAHCLAGSSVCFGAHAMVIPLRRIEDASERRDLENIRALYEEALAAFHRVKDFMAP